jgi:hypothetical protein
MAPYHRRMYCLNIALRSVRPLHLCFESEPEAAAACETFATDIADAPDGGLVSIAQDDRRRVAFLKRDFRSLEFFRNDDDGDEESADDVGPQERLTLPPGGPEKPAPLPSPSRLISSLESALAGMVPSLLL